MNRNIDDEKLKASVAAGSIEWQRHSLEKMFERNITRDQVIETILSGERVRDYPEDTPLPSALFLLFINTKPIHVVVAFSSELLRAYVITVYQPDLDHFEADFKTRRKK